MLTTSDAKLCVNCFRRKIICQLLQTQKYMSIASDAKLYVNCFRRKIMYQLLQMQNYVSTASDAKLCVNCFRRKNGLHTCGRPVPKRGLRWDRKITGGGIGTCRDVAPMSRSNNLRYSVSTSEACNASCDCS